VIRRSFYFVALLLRRFKNVHYFNLENAKGTTTALILSTIAAFLFIMAWFWPTFDAVIIITAILYIGLVFLGFYLVDTLVAKYEDKLKSELHTWEKEYYFTQCQLMQESTEQVKAIRHDMKLHLATLKDFTTTGDIEDIKKYLASLALDIEKSETYSDTGNISFDSIINYKLVGVENDNIELDLNIPLPSKINIEMVDVVTITGNMLDNALEAVAKVNEKTIKLDIAFIKGALFIKVQNSFNGEIKLSEKEVDNEQRLISLKGTSEHGYGLKNIKKSAAKYNGHVEFNYTEKLFSTGVFLYADAY